MAPSAGWQQDPKDRNFERYWDGEQWTNQTRRRSNARDSHPRVEQPPATVPRMSLRWLLGIAAVFFLSGALSLASIGNFGGCLSFTAASASCLIPSILQPWLVTRGRPPLRATRWLPIAVGLMVIGMIGDATQVTMSPSARQSETDKRVQQSERKTTPPSPESTAAPEPVQELELLDCAPPTVEVLEIEWEHPATATDPQNVFRRTMTVRIVNHSQHSIRTSGAGFNMAWRTPDGRVVNMAEDIFDGKRSWMSWDSVPGSNNLEPVSDRVEGQGSVEYTRSFGSYADIYTDGTEPWVHQRHVFYEFDNPDLERACEEQRARLGQARQADGHTEIR
ncbi:MULTISPECIES: DUF2510 domain-containing protein [Rhodococcus]|uniref:DUF2510 domain-containing protein n=1 Tax=Rhodococcus TaxID=1827 RepID=UPI000903F7FD|nr:MULTISPECIES: DUF2510 domain-containing protein [Rhodococcus]WAL49722.1 DUF2510 domain-containing protein [Rhodococcus pyridinivorans]